MVSRAVLNSQAWQFRLDSVATIAALRALATLTVENGQNIAVDGNNSLGDGGGGLFVWAKLSVAVDNGLTVIRPTDVAPNGAGRWLLIGGAANDLSNVPGLVEAATDFEGSGVASLKHNRLIFIDPAPTNTDVFGIKVMRRAPTGGTAGWVNAGLIVDLTTQAGTTAFEWGAIFKLDNYANAGQNVALYGQAYKRGDASTGAAVFEAIDPRAIANPTTGMPSLEVDIRACGTDDLNSRNAIDIVATRLGPDGAHTGADMVCGSGLSFQNGSDVGRAAFGRLIWAKPGTATNIGIDLSVATISSIAILLAQNQVICFDVGLTRKLYHNGGGYQFCGSAGTPVAQIADSGAYYVGANQIIGGRNTGWTASTGTATKGGFDASSVTLPQLASQVKALQDALTLHGLIGS